MLDSLRGIAAVSVMLFHYLYVYHNEFGYSKKPVIEFEYGFLGVHLFFMISGFVIYFSISNSKDVRDFLIKRFIRLYPTFWLCLIITFTLVSIFGISAYRNTNIFDALANTTMIIMEAAHVKAVDSSYWSLQIELFFYFFIAFIFLLKMQRHIDLILAGWLILIVVYNFIYRIPVAGLFLNLRYGMYFIAGISFYKIKVLKQEKIFNHLIIISSYIIALQTFKDMPGHVGGITASYCVFYLFIYDKLFFLKNSFLLFLGKISYPLYLIHHYVGIIILQQLKFHGWCHPVVVIIPVAVSVLLGWLINDYYDAKVSRWLKGKLISPRPAIA